MIAALVHILLLPLIFAVGAKQISTIRYNSLLSAQCKARCLYEYGPHAHQQRSMAANTFTDGKSKRSLTSPVLTLPWRSIWERCPRFISCSSCLLPCDLDPPLLLSNEQTCQAICSTLTTVECHRSCQFIQNLYREQSNCLTGHCQTCSLGNDCSESIPHPYNVTALERKSRRTVKLKWHSNGRTQLEPVFYVIEAQWTLPKSDLHPYELVSKWGFVKEEVSHTKAIIRNIQRDHRWYLFRIAAVTRHGFSAYSMTKKPFRLTNPSPTLLRRIESPKNFSVKDVQLDVTTMNVTLTWQKSDPPADGYQISWESENGQSSLFNTIDLSSTELIIPFLSMDNSYLFRIRSIIITDGEHVQQSVPRLIHFHWQEEFASLKNLQISPPYFLNGLIQANISWERISSDPIRQYDLSWIETDCHADVSSCCYRRDAVTIQNYFQLYDLRFNCRYSISILPIGPTKAASNRKSSHFYFNVSSCELTQVFGSIRPPCQTDRKTVDTFSSLPSLDLLVSRNRSGWHFYWQNVHSATHGLLYRLHIEQMPNHVELISVHLPSSITDYFLPHTKDEHNRYLNVTLSLMDNGTVRQQQSILTNKRTENDDQSSLNTSSSATAMICLRWVLLDVLFLSLELIRRRY